MSGSYTASRGTPVSLHPRGEVNAFGLALSWRVVQHLAVTSCGELERCGFECPLFFNSLSFYHNKIDRQPMLRDGSSGQQTRANHYSSASAMRSATTSEN